MPLCNYKIEQQYFTNSIVSSKTQTLLNAHSISNLSQQLSLLVSQRQKGRRQHLKSFRHKLTTCAVLRDSLPKHCMDAKNLGGFQAGRNWGNQVISAEATIQVTLSVYREWHAARKFQTRTCRRVEKSHKEVLHNVLLLPASRHCYKSGYGDTNTFFSTECNLY